MTLARLAQPEPLALAGKGIGITALGASGCLAAERRGARPVLRHLLHGLRDRRRAAGDAAIHERRRRPLEDLGGGRAVRRPGCGRARQRPLRGRRRPAVLGRRRGDAAGGKLGQEYLFTAADAVAGDDVWAVDASGALLHSTDGVHWIEQTDPASPVRRWANELSGVSFADADDGWVVGSDPTGRPASSCTRVTAAPRGLPRRPS